MKKSRLKNGSDFLWPFFPVKTLLLKSMMAWLVISLTAFQLQAKDSLPEEEKISLVKEFASIKEILKAVEKQTEFRFFYNHQHVDVKTTISVNLKDVTVRQALDEIFKDASIGYKISGRQILLFKMNKALLNLSGLLQESYDETIDIFSLLELSGTVTSATGEVMPGVNVVEKGTTNGTATDAEGRYSLTVSDVNAVLVFSFIGYTSQEVSVNGRSVIDVALAEDVKRLEEIVVVGYGEIAKRDLTGSVSSINMKDINIPVTSVDQALTGLAAGVHVVQTSGQPGAGTTIRIRGGNSISANNEPLYVVDGFIGVGDLNTINVQDIESIEVLKDASALSIYGTRGANGVVLITTKKGSKSGFKIDYHGYTGVQKVFKTIDLMNAQQFAELRNEVNIQQGLAPTYDDPQQLGTGTDWQNEIFRQASMQEHQLTFSGGSNSTQYFVSANYLNQEGIILNSGFTRYSLRFNLNSKLSERFTIGSALTLGRAETDNATIQPPLGFVPTLPPFDANGEPTTLLLDGREHDNPLTLATMPISNNNVNKVLANVFGELTIVEGLKFKTNLGIQATFGRANSYDPRALVRQASTGGSASIASNETLDLLNEYTLNYKKTFNDRHYLDVLGGFTLQGLRREAFSASSTGFVNDALTYYGLGSGKNPGAPSSGITEASFISYLGRVNYIFDDKYLLTLSGRVDGSSKFGVNNKYAFFPSASVAWRISEEETVKNLQFFDDLKIRTSFGVIGNTPNESYISIPNLTRSTYNFGQTLVSGFSATRLANNNLKWEQTASLDIGLDAAIFKSRIHLTFDYYYKKTTDLLLDVKIPSASGFSTSFQNVGSLKNSGFDISIAFVNIDKDIFKWETTLNMSHNRNELLSLSSGLQQTFVAVGTRGLDQHPAGILRVGEAVGSFYGLVSDGVWNSQAEIDQAGIATTVRMEPGAERYKDINNDNIIDGNDRTILGNDTPDFFGGIFNELTFKNWQLNIFFDGIFGNEVFNFNDAFQAAPNGAYNQYAEISNRWSPSNPSSNIIGASISSASLEPRSRWIKDGSYLRLRDITLAYNIPLKRSLLKSPQIYLSGTNLLRIDNYNGYDPQVSGYGQDNLRRATDLGGFPSSKVYRIGVKFGF